MDTYMNIIIIYSAVIQVKGTRRSLVAFKYKHLQERKIVKWASKHRYVRYDNNDVLGVQICTDKGK